MLISDLGTLVRTRVNEVSVIARNTQGVTLIRTAEDETVVGLQRIEEVESLECDSDFEAENEDSENNSESVTAGANDTESNEAKPESPTGDGASSSDSTDD